jgi:hypothetical protein
MNRFNSERQLGQTQSYLSMYKHWLRLLGITVTFILALISLPRAEADTILYASTGETNFNGGGRLWLIDVTTQTATLIGNTGFDRLGGIAFDSNGTLYGVSGGATHPPSTLMTIDRNTGEATVIGSNTGNVGVDGLRFNSQGVLYGVGWNNTNSVGVLVTIDPSNSNILSSLTLMAPSGGDPFCAGIAFAPRGLLYGARGNSIGRNEDIDLIDRVSGVLTPIGPTEVVISDIALAPDGTLYGISTDPAGNPSDLYSIDPITGTKTLLFNTGIAKLSGLAAAPRRPCSGGLYGISNGFGVPENNLIYQIDPANGNVSNAVQVRLLGFTVFNSQSLVARPSDGVLFAVVQTGMGPTTRRLVTVDQFTGVASDIGPLTQAIACLAFRSNGTLYAVSGEQGPNPETLFTVDTFNAALTLVCALGNGADGETIAFHPNGLLYHSSGNDTAIFESVDVDTCTVTPIGTSAPEAFAMGYSPTLGQMFLSDLNNDLDTVDINTGARTLIGSIPPQGPFANNRGLAFCTAGPRPTPTPRPRPTPPPRP